MPHRVDRVPDGADHCVSHRRRHKRSIRVPDPVLSAAPVVRVQHGRHQLRQLDGLHDPGGQSVQLRDGDAANLQRQQYAAHHRHHARHLSGHPVRGVQGGGRALPSVGVTDCFSADAVAGSHQRDRSRAGQLPGAGQGWLFIWAVRIQLRTVVLCVPPREALPQLG